MSRDLSLYLADILNSIEKIKRYTAQMTYEDLLVDERTLDAVTHNLQIIGEAVKQIPPSLRTQYPQIEWRKIAGLRDIVAHTYFYLNPQLVWDIVQTKLDPLRDCIQLMQADNSF